jgi:hypothetical protein
MDGSDSYGGTEQEDAGPAATPLHSNPRERRRRVPNWVKWPALLLAAACAHAAFHSPAGTGGLGVLLSLVSAEVVVAVAIAALAFLLVPIPVSWTAFVAASLALAGLSAFMGWLWPPHGKALKVLGRLQGCCGIRGWLLAAATALIAFVVLYDSRYTAVLTGGALLLLGIRHTVPAVPGTTRRGSAHAGSIALVLVSIVVALGLLELGVRLLFPADLLAPDMFEPHPTCQRTLRRGASGTQAFLLDDGRIGRVGYTISSQGLRDREYTAKEPGEFRILFLGDSFIFGNGLEQDVTLSRRVESVLREELPDRRVTVINAGCPAYGPWQEHGFFLERGLPLEPDLVVLQVLPDNDVGDTLIREGRVLRAFDPLAAENKTMWAHYYSDPKMRLELWLRMHSEAYNRLWCAGSGRYSLSRALNATRWFHNPRIPVFPDPEPRPWFLEIHLKEWYPELEEGWRRLEEDVRSIRRDCVERGIGFAAFAVPTGGTVAESAWRRITGSWPGIYEREKGIRVAEAFFARERIPYIRLLDVLSRHPTPRELYYERDGHFTPKGADVVARHLARQLVQQGLIADQPTSGELRTLKPSS